MLTKDRRGQEGKEKRRQGTCQAGGVTHREKWPRGGPQQWAQGEMTGCGSNREIAPTFFPRGLNMGRRKVSFMLGPEHWQAELLPPRAGGPASGGGRMGPVERSQKLVRVISECMLTIQVEVPIGVRNPRQWSERRWACV